MAGAPRRYSDRAREILYERAFDHGETAAQGAAAVLAETGEEIAKRVAQGIVQRERLKREQSARDAAYATDPARAVEELAARLYAVAARVVKREERRSSPDLVRLKRAASIVRELRPMLEARPRSSSPAAPEPDTDNGHDSSEATRLASALEASRSSSP